MRKAYDLRMLIRRKAISFARESTEKVAETETGPNGIIVAISNYQDLVMQ